MSNYYVREGYIAEELIEAQAEIEKRLADIGALYNDPTLIPVSTYQDKARELHREGYSYGEQIHDCYAEIGAILEAMEAL
jgi:hypothetical protein